MHESRSDHGGNRYYEAAREHRARLKSGETTESSIVELRQDSKNFADGISESKIAMSLEAARKSKGDGSNPSWTVHDGGMFAKDMFSGSARLPMEGRILQAMSAFEVQPLSRQELAEVEPVSSRPSRRSSSPMPSSFRASPSFRDEPGLVDPLPPPRLDELGGTTMREADFASIERIGVGQFATVHSSRVSGGKFAAVKIWHRPVAITDANDLPSGSDYDEPLPIDLADIACFAQEVALLASSDLAHPNVVKYLGHGFVPIPGTNRVRGFVAMELVEGTELRRELADCSERRMRGEAGLSLFLAIRWSVQLARTLAHLHSRRVIHRDVKLSNIMIAAGASRDLKLVDFGLALRMPPAPPGADAAVCLTAFQASQKVGVYGYMPPEVHRKKPYGFAVDVFAMGVVLRRTLCCAAPPPPHLKLKSSAQSALYSVVPTSWAYELQCQPTINPRWPHPNLVAVARDTADPSPTRRPTAGKVTDLLEEVLRAAEADPAAYGATP